MRKLFFVLLIAATSNAQNTPQGIFTKSPYGGYGSVDSQYTNYINSPFRTRQERDTATFKYNMYKEAERNLQAESKPLIKEKTIFDYYLESEREQQKQREEIDAQFPID